MSLDSVSSGHQDASKGDKIDIGRGLSGLTGLTKALNATLLERLGMKISLKSVAYLHQYLRMCLKLDSFLMRLRQTVNKGIKQREPSSRRADGRAKDQCMDWDKSKQCVWIKYEEKSQENSARVKLPIISNTMERRVLTDPNEIVRRRIAGKLYRIAQKYGQKVPLVKCINQQHDVAEGKCYRLKCLFLFFDLDIERSSDHIARLSHALENKFRSNQLEIYSQGSRKNSMLSVYNGQNFQEQFEKRYIKFEGLLAHLERMLGERETEMTEVIGVATSIKKQVEATISRFTLVPCAAQELYRHKSKRVCGY